MDAPTAGQVGPGTRRDLHRGLIVLAMALAPSLAAIAWVPEFVTQDGPAHVYNARILNASLSANSPFLGAFEVAWRPSPNWAGHLGTMALVAVLSPGVAGRVMAALTLVGLAGSVVWLRWAVAGPKGLATASVLAAVLALNVTWLLGFTSFLLGAALMAVTLALWWGGREWFGPGRALGLSILLVLGYFCHPISLGLTVVGLGVLAILTSSVGRTRRATWTVASLLPLVPLGLAYRAMTRSAGALEPVWENLANPRSPRAWLRQVGWIDPLSLAAKTYRPFSEVASKFHGVSSPAIWAAIAIGVLAVATWGRRASDRRGWLALGKFLPTVDLHRGRRASDRRGWLVLAGLLLLGGLVGPDTLGVKHGHYLPQRVALLGLMMLVPWLDLSGGRLAVRVASGSLVLALGLQSAFVWDYALDCRRKLGPLLKAGPAVGTNTRVATLLVGIKGRFRANPILHADGLLGASGGDVVWSNYETTHYYFPVKVRPGVDHPPAGEFEQIALLDPATEADERAGLWEALLDGHGRSIDRIVEWTSSPSPQLDAINRRQGYERTFEDGPIRVWARRPEVAPDGGGPR